MAPNPRPNKPTPNPLTAALIYPTYQYGEYTEEQPANIRIGSIPHASKESAQSSRPVQGETDPTCVSKEGSTQ
jgi:hypothetical protein